MPVGAPTGITYNATGNINPSRFVKIDTTQPQGGTGCVIQCTGSDIPVGVSNQGVHNPPLAGLDDGYAAIAGLSIRVYGAGEICWLQTGTTAFNAGVYLKPDSTGRGTPITSTADVYGATALENSSGDGVSLVRCMVTSPIAGAGI